MISRAALAFSLSLFAAHAMAAGALAIDSKKGDQWGVAWDYPSTGQAEQRALRECGRGCQVVLAFDKGCGAYAADQARGSKAAGWANYETRDLAKERALLQCNAKGGPNSKCVIRSWGCNSR